jgi:arylsulfatase A-like enzyme
MLDPSPSSDREAREAPQRTGVLARLAGAVVVAACFAAADTILTRREFSYRPRDFELYLECTLLWLGYALLALPPAMLLDRVLRRRTRDPRFAHPARAAARHAAWTVGPVLVHARLDEYTGLGGDTSRLLSVAPWASATAAVLACVVGALVVGRGLQRLRPGISAVAILLIAIACGRWISCEGSTRLRVRSGEAGPKEQVDGRPNVLLLVWDTTRATSLSLYGYGRDTTPNLVELADSSILYANARSVSVYTLTSHISMLTGVYPSDHGARVIRQRFDPRRTPPVVEEFADAGYRTAAFVGTDVLRAHSGVMHGFERYDDQVDPWVTYARGWALLHDLQSVLARVIPALDRNGQPHWIQDFQRPADDVLRDAREWIESDDPRPWLCMVNLYDAHWPYQPERSEVEAWVGPYEGIIDGFSHRGRRVKSSGKPLGPEDKRHVAELYDGELNGLDRTVDAFLDRLDLGSTALVLTSDHGEAFGEGEPARFEHADMLDCQTRVPLLVRPAGGTEKRVVEAPVNGVDIAPTLLALAGLSTTNRMLGRNLLGELPQDHPLLVEDRDHPNRHYMKLALWSGPWKLVRAGLPPACRWRLYDAANDPEERRDVADQHPEVVDELRRRMNELRASWHADDLADLEGTEVRNLDALQALGYAGEQ